MLLPKETCHLNVPRAHYTEVPLPSRDAASELYSCLPTRILSLLQRTDVDLWYVTHPALHDRPAGGQTGNYFLNEEPAFQLLLLPSGAKGLSECGHVQASAGSLLWVFLDLGPICYVSHGSGERDPVPGAGCPMARGCPLQLLQVIS